ncbi:uncharacterized protein PADG_03426 [Paracoccidioides brasiliensis Pb18]|uniref:HORMA domain-containing protein n=1 Tax=Paracoccidioides brasiliensis (strain Pb18) TaxID=502780 RepID=C1G556_PARBD|nr:uncharacterized protein PADG_03426 [Paracoccidioides brasiliensis Pb18]EEH47328.1 hypothetical protein PADG_03426 [Paracoccidioides brasiliensis Pb18]
MAQTTSSPANADIGSSSSSFPHEALPAGPVSSPPHTTATNNNNGFQRHTNTTSTSSIISNGNHNNTCHTHNHRPSQLPDTYAALTASIASFLAVSIHQILYLRAIYPQSTFLPVRHFNRPVRQSRHPRVCTWITDACAAVEAQLLKCTIAAVSIVILSSSNNQPLERYTFDMTQIPEVPPGDVRTPFDNDNDNSRASEDPKNQQQQQQQQSIKPQTHIPPVELEAQFRAVLARLASACARLTPLPRNEEYIPTLHIVLRNTADAPAGISNADHLWIAAEPSKLDLNGNCNSSNTANGCGIFLSGKCAVGGVGEFDRAGSRGRAKTVPVRTVDAGELKMEIWVEEAKGKFAELNRIRAVHET